ncbi:MAG: rhodanese-like domain-containing protein [Anaerolineaceae bacterium]|jgi:rhodanese-related sulfurtransferase|nr:rhodanese-like domain-containing protein [Anaerolineaceae bacterium]
MKTQQNKILILITGIAIVLLSIFSAAAFRPIDAVQAGAVSQALAAQVSVNEAAQLREEGALILDVREPQEWEAGHIPGATLIPLGQIPDRLNEIPQDRPVVVVCRSGNRSAQAVQFLRQSGYGLTTSMSGGMNQWVAANFEIVTGP